VIKLTSYLLVRAHQVHMTKALCRALSPRNITVNCIAPGLFPSDMTKFVVKASGMWEMQAEANPLKRNGQTSDIAGVTLFLVSKAGSWTNGVRALRFICIYMLVWGVLTDLTVINLGNYSSRWRERRTRRGAWIFEDVKLCLCAK